MRIIRMIATVVTLTLALAVPAFAGDSAILPVRVDVDQRVAFGNFLAARISDNEVENIGCSLLGGDFVVCSAQDANGVSGSCYAFASRDPLVVETVKSLSDYSYLFFSWDENDVCLGVSIRKSSSFLPDKKTK